ncbi:hypothetical protein F503_01378 [Ophiostoma piceae UAMH 11346]|uniref:Uncharacterized protein n=1 Tax=Ophiostoma piceae (strain UAMH 11346) TaxID=1262450 RepID=S3BSX8_OPHP1|nr:hypothetical protein F503_01378 [Ophiostoma piceae UAMH 11346]
MASLPSLTELGLLGQSPYNEFNSSSSYSPWWTTLEGDADDDVFRGQKIMTRDDRPRKRRAVSPDDQDKPTLSLSIPDDEDVPELDDSLDESPESSPEPSPQASPQTSPETASADLALPIRRILPPHYLLPLPVARKDWDAEARHIQRQSETTDTRDREDSKRKRDAPTRLKMANLLSPTPHVYCLYKFDRVDQLGGKRRGMR